MKSDLINVTQLEDVLRLITPTTEEYAEALQKAIEVISEQPLVTYSEPAELLVKESDYPLDATTIVSGTLSLSDICNPSLMALQCKSCGGVIDKDTMTCKHCGMTYMLVNNSEINPRYSNF